MGECEPLAARRLAAAHEDQRVVAHADTEAVDRLGKRRQVHIQPEPLLQELWKAKHRPVPEPQSSPNPSGKPPALFDGRAATDPAELRRRRVESSGSKDRVEQLVEPAQCPRALEGPVDRARVTEVAQAGRDRQDGPLAGAQQVEDRDTEQLGQLGQLQRADGPSPGLDPRHGGLGQADPLGQLPLCPALASASVGDALSELLLGDGLHQTPPGSDTIWANVRSYARKAYTATIYAQGCWESCARLARLGYGACGGGSWWLGWPGWRRARRGVGRRGRSVPCRSASPCPARRSPPGRRSLSGSPARARTSRRRWPGRAWPPGRPRSPWWSTTPTRPAAPTCTGW